MDQDLVLTLLWLAAGLLLVGLEFLLPGMVSIFLGAAALVVALLRWAGAISGMPISVLAWMVLSVLMVVGLRGVVRRLFAPEESQGSTDEELAAFGQEVEVTEDCYEAARVPPPGRIRFQGSSWPAFSCSGVVRKGGRARLVYRENLTWVVEPVGTQQLEAGSATPVPTAAMPDAAVPSAGVPDAGTATTVTATAKTSTAADTTAAPRKGAT